ncbi:hypothetical protein AB4Y63_13135 [Leifsonia sp. YAF41]|uniref:hypothetical protein n=1 Tax=Leifsonia sp. YAF41 TaxID=3233086 RepID=UPI003F9E66C7
MRTASGGRHTAADAVRARAGLLLVAAALVLSGCASAPDPVPSESRSAAEPVFASDEEALAAATEAYAAYLQMSDQILMDGGFDPDRIRPLVSRPMAESEIRGFKEISDKGYRSSGGSEFENLTLQSREEADGESSGRIVVYLCSDVSAVDVWDSNGVSVISASRPDRTPFEVVFTSNTSDPQHLIVSSSDVWEGNGVC